MHTLFDSELHHPSQFAARATQLLLLGIFVIAVASPLFANEPIRLLNQFSLNADGTQLAFSWLGDVWQVPSQGGTARQLTRHAASDSQPCFSPDGTEIAFVSDRTGSTQIFVMPSAGGSPEQITHHSAGHSLLEYTSDGSQFLVRALRDHFWRPSSRLFLIERNERRAEKLLFDAYGSSATLDPLRQRLLFTREGESWWRKGYRGTQAGQIWMAQLESGIFTELLVDDRGFRNPMWNAEGDGFFYVGQQDGTFNLWSYNLRTEQRTQLTRYKDDGIAFPAISRDGQVIVFRRLFDLYRYQVGSGQPPQRIEIVNSGEPLAPTLFRRTLDSASDTSFSDDGLEVAFVSGGDIWVMDTELQEPRQVTQTPYDEREPLFHPDGNRLLYISDDEGQTDLWVAERNDADLYWWQNPEFTRKRITADSEVEADISFSPDGQHLAYLRGSHLWIRDIELKQPRQLTTSWSEPQYDWSPDGRWVTYAEYDDDFNSDIWVLPLDGHRAPFNLSVHPDNDRNPVWSPDGKIIAFTGRRDNDETDLHYVYLRKEDDELDSRDRRLAKALEKMQKARSKPRKKGGPAVQEPADTPADTPLADPPQKAPQGDPPSDPPSSPPASDPPKSAPPKKNAKGADPDPGDTSEDETKAPSNNKDENELPAVRIDFEGIHERLRTISNRDAAESAPFWLGDDTLLVATTVAGKSGLYKITFPDELKLEWVTATRFSPAHPIGNGKKRQWVGISGNKPATLDAKGKVTSYAVSARQEMRWSDRYRAGFNTAWRLMRDNFYDPNLNNRNWSEVRRKYEEMAAAAPDAGTLQSVIQMMLGELNGSHLGFNPRRSAPPAGATPAWTEETPHLGLRFDDAYQGPGWRVRDVLPQGPTSEQESRVEAGEVVLAVDGIEVDPAMDPTRVLNGPLARDIELRIRSLEGTERTVLVRPIDFGRARSLLYEQWLQHNRQRVDDLSHGTLGYLHIRGMNWSSFLKFEQELFRVGYGKDGLVIDVRANGGGFTTDHLLTALTQPSHAITVPRAGGPGYPQDRRVYATWNKPIVVLCDQNSFSNAEIFAHAIKNLDRGKVVGVQTAGGVISTGGASVMDLGFLRMPFRGWYIEKTGEDMELNGAKPHFTVWPKPGELPRGIDKQLDKGIEVLLQEVDAWKSREQPKLRKASERRKRL